MTFYFTIYKYNIKRLSPREYINTLNNEVKEETLKKGFNPSKRIYSGIKRQFNVEYLFLENIYNLLDIKSICDSISDRYQFHFNLNQILSYLVYAIIIYPSSKLKTFKQCQTLLNNLNLNFMINKEQ